MMSLIKPFLNIGVTSIFLMFFNLFSQLGILYLYEDNTKVSDQFYLISFALGFFSLVFIDNFQTHYYKLLSKCSINDIKIRNLLASSRQKILLIPIISITLYLIETVNFFQCMMLTLIFFLVPFIVFIQQNALMKKRYLYYIQANTIVPLSVLLSILVNADYFITTLLSLILFFYLFIIFQCKFFTTGLKSNTELNFIYHSSRDLIDNVIRVSPSAVYILITATVLNYNFPGVLSVYGLMYSVIGFLSVILGQNIASALLIVDTQQSIKISTFKAPILYFSLIYASLIFILTVLIYLTARVMSLLPILLFLNSQFEFLQLHAFIAAASIVGFSVFNILRGILITKKLIRCISIGNIVGLLTFMILMTFSLILNNLAMTLIALPFSLLFGNLRSYYGLIKNTSFSES